MLGNNRDNHKEHAGAPMTVTRTTFTLAIAATLLAPAACPPARADDRPLLEELVVTARKREQNLQDVAVGVSLLSGKALVEAQLRNAAELSSLLPTLNVQASSGPSTASFNIRGIGTQAFSTAVEPSVSTMVDGVVMGNSGMAFLELVDVERVEVLRGPQGTLYGKNASGGVIHIITRDPTPEPGGTFTATALEHEEYRLGATVSGPLTDTLSWRLTGAAVDDDGYMENVYDGKTLNGTESYSARGKLLWQPDDGLELLWSSDYQRIECDCTALSVRAILPSGSQKVLLDEQLPVVPSVKNQDVNNDQRTFNDVSANGHSLTANWSVGEHTLTSISAWRDWHNEGIVDLDNRPSNPLALTFNQPPEYDREQLSQELRLMAPPEDWGFYVVGLYYFDQDADSSNTTTTALLEPRVPATTRTSRTSVGSTNYALFGELNYNLASDWMLTLGLRYTEDQLDHHTRDVGTDNLVFPPDGEVENDLDDDDWSPKVALQRDINDTAMAYASFTEGYKGPAFDTSVVAGGRTIEPETSDAWETGLKSSWLDGRLVLNLALFYAEYQDFQAQALIDEDPDDLLPESFLLTNAGEVSTQGVELEFIGQPRAQWTVSGGIAWTDGTIDKYPAGNCSAGQKFRGECPDGFQDLSGGQLPYTPDWKLNLATDYRIPLQDSALEVVLGGELRAQDNTLYEISQDPHTRQQDFTVVDVRASLAGTDRGWRATAFVKNLFDEDYATLIYAQSEVLIPHGYIHYVPKYANRTVGVELRYDF